MATIRVFCKRVTIKIPRELYQSLSQMIDVSGFSSVNDFIVFIMRTLASNREGKSDDKLTAEEIKAIRARLRRLDYLQEEL